MNSTQTAFGTYAHLPKIFKTFTTTSGGLPESGRMTSTPANVQKKNNSWFLKRRSNINNCSICLNNKPRDGMDSMPTKEQVTKSNFELVDGRLLHCNQSLFSSK